MPPSVPRELERRVRHVRQQLASRVRSWIATLYARLPLHTVRGPGDAEPPRGFAARYDYRDVLEIDQVPVGYARGAFGLGDAFDLHRGHRGRIALPADALKKHVAIMGPRRHETRRLLLAPWIAGALELDWAVLAIDADGDLSEVVDLEVIESSRGRGRMRHVIDPSHPAGSSTWNWLGDLDESSIDAAVRALVGLTDAAALAGPAVDARILRGLLELSRDRAIAHRGTAIAAALRSHETFTSVLARDRHSDGGARLHELSAKRPGAFAATVAGARRRLVRLERHLGRTRGRDAVVLDELLGLPQALTLVSRPRDRAPGRTLAALLTAVLVERAFRRHGQRQLLVVIEDARTVLHGLDLAELLEIGRSAGVAFVLCTPTVGAYGAQGPEILRRCGTLVATAGCSPATAEFMSTRIAGRGFQLGDREIYRPPFPGRIAIVDSEPVADRPFVVDLSA